MQISEKDILEVVKKLIEFPYPQVCRHYVAANLLDLLERKGYSLSSSLAKSVVKCDDERALLEIETILKE